MAHPEGRIQSESEGNSSRPTFLHTQFGISGSDASKYLETESFTLVIIIKERPVKGAAYIYEYAVAQLPYYLLERIEADDIAGQRHDVVAGDLAGGNAARHQLPCARASLHPVGLSPAPQT